MYMYVQIYVYTYIHVYIFICTYIQLQLNALFSMIGPLRTYEPIYIDWCVPLGLQLVRISHTYMWYCFICAGYIYVIIHVWSYVYVLTFVYVITYVYVTYEPINYKSVGSLGSSVGSYVPYICVILVHRCGVYICVHTYMYMITYIYMWHTNQRTWSHICMWHMCETLYVYDYIYVCDTRTIYVKHYMYMITYI